MADIEEKRGPLSEQLARARLEAANRSAREVGQPEPAESAGDDYLAPTGKPPIAARGDSQWVREVRLGIEVLTNMRHQPPPSPAGWRPPPSRAGKLYRRGLGRVV